MRIRTQGGLCQLDFNRKTKIFLETSNNRKVIQDFIHHLAFKIYKNNPPNWEETAVLSYLNEPEKTVLLYFRKSGRLVVQIVDKNGNKLEKTEKIDNVKEFLTNLCGKECNFKNSFDILLTYFEKIKLGVKDENCR